MVSFFQALTGNYKSSAKVVDGSLVLTLPNALSPVVWRMDLKHAKSSALEIKETDNNQFELILKTTDKKIETIAPFEKRGPAIEALLIASKALESAPLNTAVKAAEASNENAALNIAPAAVNVSQKKSKWPVIIGGFIVITALVFFLANLDPGPSTGQTTTTNQSGSSLTGVPLSADEFLQGR